MKRLLTLAATISVCHFLFSTVQAQEVLAPLSASTMPQAAKSSDTVVLELPFFDDFADYEGLPHPGRWLCRQAFVNKDYGPQAPTVGVATLDALDGDGNLYPHASSNLFAADTMASQIIRLDSLTGTYQRRLQPADSIRLSFFYLPGGWYGNQWELVGDAPATQDSLFLEFYDANAQQWDIVWATPGFNADTAGTTSHWPWRFASISIDDTRYFTKRFQFRFRNYASLDPNPKSGIAGNCDQWNIDYVYLNYNRTIADSAFRDVAFVDKAPSMLKNYQAMPARQYRTADMATGLDIKIVNRYNQTLASSYAYKVLDNNGQQIAQYDGGFENIQPFFPNGRYQESAIHCNPSVSFAFPESNTPTAYEIVHTVREGVSGDSHNGNDTVRFVQTFGDYYAYDDGIAENGYGLSSTGSRMWLACRYDLNTADTLTAIDLCFNRTRNGENEDVRFQLCVWAAQNGLPATLLYKDDEKFTPQFDGRNAFHRYCLSQPVTVDDTIFIGFEQLSNDYINLGFDRSTDSRRYTFYRTGNEWMQSILSGSVMMRPAFGEQATVAVNQAAQSCPQFTVYPNPASTVVTLNTGSTGQSVDVALLDINGRTIQTIRQYSNAAVTLNVGNLTNGIYIIRLTDTKTGIKAHKKLIIKR